MDMTPDQQEALRHQLGLDTSAGSCGSSSDDLRIARRLGRSFGDRRASMRSSPSACLDAPAKRDCARALDTGRVAGRELSATGVLRRRPPPSRSSASSVSRSRRSGSRSSSSCSSRPIAVAAGLRVGDAGAAYSLGDRVEHLILPALVPRNRYAANLVDSCARRSSRSWDRITCAPRARRAFRATACSPTTPSGTPSSVVTASEYSSRA